MGLLETYWYSWFVLEAIDMNELVKTVMSSALWKVTFVVARRNAEVDLQYNKMADNEKKAH